MSDARLTTESLFTSPSPLLLTLQSVFCGDTKRHASIHRAITSGLKNEWGHPPPPSVSWMLQGTGTLQLGSNPFCSLSPSLYVCVLLQLVPQKFYPQENHCFKGLQRSKKPTNPSSSSRMALIIPTAAATPFSLRDTDMQTCQKHHHKTSISDICWILIRELILHTDFNAPWSPSQPPLSKLYLTYIYVTCY